MISKRAFDLIKSKTAEPAANILREQLLGEHSDAYAQTAWAGMLTGHGKGWLALKETLR